MCVGGYTEGFLGLGLIQIVAIKNVSVHFKRTTSELYMLI